jgi:hypothetical protein
VVIPINVEQPQSQFSFPVERLSGSACGHTLGVVSSGFAVVEPMVVTSSSNIITISLLSVVDVVVVVVLLL